MKDREEGREEEREGKGWVDQRGKRREITTDRKEPSRDEKRER